MAVIVLKIVKRVENYIIFTLHTGNVLLRCREIVKTHQKRVNSVNHTFIECAVGVVAPASKCLCSCWRQTFRAYGAKMMKNLRDDEFRDDNCR